MRTPSIVALLVFAAALAGPPPAVSADPLSLKTHPVPSDRVAPPLPDRDLYPQRPSLPQTPKFIRPLSRDTRIVVEKLLDGIATFQKVEQGLDRHARTDEHGRPAQKNCDSAASGRLYLGGLGVFA